MMNINQFFISNIKEFVPSWRHLEKDDLRITKTIGITNKTYIIEADAEPSRIIFRHFGEVGVGLFLDRQLEHQIGRKIAQCDMGPYFYGHTKQVRLEQYLESQVVCQEQMQELETYTLVASMLCKFHSIDMSDLIQDKTPLLEKHLKNDSNFLIQLRQKLQSDCFSNEEKEILASMSKWFSEEEIQFLRENTPQEDIVFSHNDLLANNILQLIDSEQNLTQKVAFIDFEYSSYNYRGFDIANYFNESLFSYVNPNPPYFFIEEGLVQDEILEDFIKVYIEKSGLDLDFDSLLQQVHIGFLHSHFFWGVWSIIMAKSNDIEFDYISFLEARYHKYYAQKEYYFGKK